MNRIWKKISVFVLTFTLLIGMVHIDANAAGASVTIALSSRTVSIGNTVTATINVSGSDISAYTIYVTYNSSVLEYSSSSGSATAGGGGGTLVLSGTGAGSTSLSFKAIANGTSGISTSGSEVYDINYNEISISHAGVNVTVETQSGGSTGNTGGTGSTGSTGSGDNTSEGTTEDSGLSNDCSLKSLQVSPGTLSPSFSSGTTNYTVRLDKDATSIVVSAVATDEKASTSVSGANSLTPGENSVRVTVTAENGAVRVYRINVICGEVIEDVKVTINGIEYSFINDESIPDVPEDFKETTITYNDLEVPAYQSPNGKINIVCLEAEDVPAAWYIFNEETLQFIPYVEYSSAYVRYVILEMPDDISIPENYHETELMLGDMSVKAYTVDEATGIFLIYAMNIDGEEGLYYYDTKEQAFMRYVDIPLYLVENATPDEATPDTATPVEPVAGDTEGPDDGIFTKENLMYMLAGAALLIIILLIVTTTLGVKNSKLKKKLPESYFDEDDNDIFSDEEVNEDNEEAVLEKSLDLSEDIQKTEVTEVPEEILLEDASDSYDPDFKPEIKETPEREKKVNEAIKERPFGIDSAFDVVPEDEIKPEDEQKTDMVRDRKNNDSGIEIPEGPYEEDY